MSESTDSESNEVNVQASEFLNFVANHGDMQQKRILYEAIQAHEDDGDKPGAPVGSVMETAITVEESRPWLLGLALYELCTRGEIYCPTASTVKTIELREDPVNERLDEAANEDEDPVTPAEFTFQFRPDAFDSVHHADDGVLTMKMDESQLRALDTAVARRFDMHNIDRTTSQSDE